MSCARLIDCPLKNSARVACHVIRLTFPLPRENFVAWEPPPLSRENLLKILWKIIWKNRFARLSFLILVFAYGNMLGIHVFHARLSILILDCNERGCIFNKSPIRSALKVWILYFWPLTIYWLEKNSHILDLS